MKNDQSSTPLQPSLYVPLSHWASGFEYAFGYQLKLIREFWGITDDAE